MENFKLKTFAFLDQINTNTLKILQIGNMLPNIVKNFLIYSLVKEITLEQNIYDKEIKNFYLKNKIINENDLENFLKNRGILEEHLYYQITLPLKIFKFAKDNFQKELKTYFLNRKDLLDVYTFNIIRVKNKDIAYEIYFRLDSKESDFINLSERFSYYSDLYPKGLYGPKNLQGINPIIKNKLIISSKDELIQPFQVDEWWIILKLIDKKKAKLDEPTSKMLLLEIFNKYINNLVGNFIEEYLKNDK